MTQVTQTDILFELGARIEVVSELLEYNRNHFSQYEKNRPSNFPLKDELYIEAWSRYIQESAQKTVLPILQQVLVQLNFPIQSGISQHPDYLKATRQGFPPSSFAPTTIIEPEALQIYLYPSLAGSIPIIQTTNRIDFETLVQAITKKNEPTHIPDTMGACIVAGYNNWDRIRQLREIWHHENPEADETAWGAEFYWRIKPFPALYQDTFVLLSSGPYSNIQNETLQLPSSDWATISNQIRLEHEATHYLTHRLFHSMRNNVLDELIADYRGILLASGDYHAHWFLTFMGLENYPVYRTGGRLENYRGTPPLSDEAFSLLQLLLYRAAHNLEQFHRRYCINHTIPQEQAKFILALTQLTIEELASGEAENYILKNLPWLPLYHIQK